LAASNARNVAGDAVDAARGRSFWRKATTPSNMSIAVLAATLAGGSVRFRAAFASRVGTWRRWAVNAPTRSSSGAYARFT